MNRTRSSSLRPERCLALSLIAAGSAQKTADTPVSPLKQLTKEARLALLRKAHVWTATNVPGWTSKRGRKVRVRSR